MVVIAIVVTAARSRFFQFMALLLGLTAVLAVLLDFFFKISFRFVDSLFAALGPRRQYSRARQQ